MCNAEREQLISDLKYFDLGQQNWMHNPFVFRIQMAAGEAQVPIG
jgi:hypothetical protein